MAVKEEVKELLDWSRFLSLPYKIASGYKELMGEQIHVHWDRFIWSSFNVPKHRFIRWLAMQDKMKTKAILARFGHIDAVKCIFFYPHVETQEHLFFTCKKTVWMLGQLKSWLGWKVITIDFKKMVRWLERVTISKAKKMIFGASLIALLYQIWVCQNKKIWMGEDPQEAGIIATVKSEIRYRVINVAYKKMNQQDREWWGNCNY